MKNNVLAALIIAAAMLGAVYLQNRQTESHVGSALLDLERASQEKDASGKTRISRFVEGIVVSVKEGFQAGLHSAAKEDDKPETPAEKKSDELSVRGKLHVKEVRIVPGEFDDERVVGILRNDSDVIVRWVSLNAVFRDKAGALLDVASGNRLSETLQPGDEFGFEITRSLGHDAEGKAVAKQNADSVTVSSLSLED